MPGSSDRLRRILVMLLMAVTGCAGPLFAASCERPLVSFQAGQLTISSTGCSLLQVLTAVGRETGSETEIPPSAGATPVFASLGPDDPRRVVSALLEGFPFNWSLKTTPDESRSLERILLTERRAPLVEETKALVGAVANVTENGTLLAGHAPAGNTGTTTKGNEAAAAASLEVQQSDQPQRRTEIDDSTLSKLPTLPPGVPTGMWQLYPGIVANGGAVQSGPPILPNGELAPAPSPATASNLPTASNVPSLAFDPASAPKGCTACPVPPGVDPAIVKLYPANLMYLVQQPITLPNIQFPPMAQPIRQP